MYFYPIDEVGLENKTSKSEVIMEYNKKTLKDISDEEKKKIIDRAEEIVGGLLVNDSDGFTYQYNGDFLDLPNELRSNQRKVYIFDFISELSDAYAITKDKKYSEKALEYINSFEEQAPFEEKSMTWHDETVAKRLNNFLYFQKTCKDTLNEETTVKLWRSSYSMASLMTYTNFYSGENNHGMFQDEAILDFSTYFYTPEMVKIASQRLFEYFSNNFSEEGVHLENSPHYHFDIMKSIINILDKYKQDKFSYYTKLRVIYEKSAEFAKLILLPDGKMPAIGDSSQIKVDLDSFYNKALLERANKTRGNFFKSGYDIVKNENTYLCMRGGYYKDYHHHDDDMSFWLYKNGNIFIEAGPYGYQDDHYYTHYVRGLRAHNTLIVDGSEETEGKDVQILESKTNTMSGISKRIKNVEFKRDIDFDEKLNNFTIKNEVKSLDNKNHKYEFLYHLNFDIEPELVQENNKFYINLYREKELIGKISSDDPLRITSSVMFEDFYSEARSIPLIIATVEGKNINNTLKLELY